MVQFLENIKLFFTEFGPRLVAGITFLPCGLIMGYTLSEFILERNTDSILRYGPLIFGILLASLCAGGLILLKFLQARLIYCHFDILIAASLFNIIGAGFFFVDSYDIIGAFLSYLCHSLTFVTTLSYLHAISQKEVRTMFISSCFLWYLLGIASAVSVITDNYEEKTSAPGTDDSSISRPWIYWHFAWLYICLSILVAGLLAAIRVLYIMGIVDYKTSLDDDFRRLNSTGAVFENRDQVIRRVRDTKSFFYVTKNKQPVISFVLLFSDAIYFALFIYFILWFTLNKSVSLISQDLGFGVLIWTAFCGLIAGTALLIFFSVKIIFIASALGQIGVAIIGIILFSTVNTSITFWLLCFLFGISFCCIKISIIETSNLKFLEILIFIFYTTNLIATAIIYNLFVSDEKNLFFYGTDRSTLMAHGFVFLIILSLITIIVSLKVPRTYRTPLFDIQYDVLGIVFAQHNIEQLNLGYINDASIPTLEATSM